MSLIEENEFARVVHLDRLGLQRMSRPIMKILGVKDLNEVYQRWGQEEGMDFIDQMLREFQVDFDFYQEELKRIPKEGPFITVSNHPLGGIDGIILIKLITQVRPDYRVMANFMLQKVEPLRDYFIPVNPFEQKELASSFAGVKRAWQHLQEGAPLGLFPAGEVSTYQWDRGRVADKEWELGALKLIQRAKVPVVPVYFKARNSTFFYLLSLLHPHLRTAKLPSELRQQKNKSIRIRIGRPINRKEQKGYPDIQHYGAFLRQRTYLLGEVLPPRRNLMVQERPEQREPVAEPGPSDELIREVERLWELPQHRLLEQRQYKLLWARAEEMPALLRELGRLRELTFREVGEGTNRPLDLDHYDYHYRHLLLWDAEAQALAGAYRLGLGTEIYPQFGVRGFYVSSLFKIKKPAHPMLAKALEMGRAFVSPEQQQRPLPLFLLWEGIREVLRRQPELEFICGCASISNQYSGFSKALMAQYLRKNFGDAQLTQFIKPRKAFKAKLPRKYQEIILQSTTEDLARIDQIVAGLEPNGKGIPVLIKKYLKQPAKMVCFNVDPLFNHSLDGFMYIQVKDLAEGRS